MRTGFLASLLLLAACHKKADVVDYHGERMEVTVSGALRPPELSADFPMCDGTSIRSLVRTPKNVVIGLDVKGTIDGVFDCYSKNKLLRVVSDIHGVNNRVLHLTDAHGKEVNLIVTKDSTGESLALMVPRDKN